MMAWSLSAEAEASLSQICAKPVCERLQDRAQLRNEFLSFDTENTGTITHLQAVLLDLAPDCHVRAPLWP